MLRRNLSMLGLSCAAVLALSACERDRERERREAIPGETRTRSGEMAREAGVEEAPRVEVPRVEVPRAEVQRVETPRAETPRNETPQRASDPRFDAGRLSIVGTAADRERNLGLVTADGGAVLPPPPAPAPVAAPPPPEEPPSPPTQRVGAGRPGAGGDPYQ